MGTRNKKLNLSINLPINNNQVHEYLVNAYGLVNKYRDKSGAPAISFDRWLLMLCIEGAKAIHQFHLAQLKQQQEQTEQQEQDKDAGAGNETAGEPSAAGMAEKN